MHDSCTFHIKRTIPSFYFDNSYCTLLWKNFLSNLLTIPFFFIMTTATVLCLGNIFSVIYVDTFFKFEFENLYEMSSRFLLPLKMCQYSTQAAQKLALSGSGNEKAFSRHLLRRDDKIVCRA